MVERRSTPRCGPDEAGEALLNPIAGPVECKIANVSAKGARLLFFKPLLLPRTFELSFKSGHRTRVKVAWQRGTTVGVRFDNPLRMRPLKKRTGTLARLLGAGA